MQAQPKTILIVDDELSILDTLQELMELEGFVVQRAVNGQEAVVSAIEDPPDIIISDVMMPRMDGHALVRTIRSMPHFQEIPIILLTALNDRSDVRYGMTSGINDYIAKPFRNNELLEAVNHHLERSERRARERARYTELLRSYHIHMDDFAFMAAHKLRGPFSNALGIVNIMQNEWGKDPLFEALQNALEETDQVIKELTHQVGKSHMELRDPDIRLSLGLVKEVLIIEDDPIQQLVIKTKITNYLPEANIQVCSDTQTAKGIIQQQHKVLDLIMLDIHLRDGQLGWDILDYMDKKELTAIPTLVVTSNLFDEEIKHSFSFEPVVGFVTKPLTEKMLSQFIL